MCIDTQLGARSHECRGAHVYVSTYIHACMHACMHTHTDTQTHIHEHIYILSVRKCMYELKTLQPQRLGLTNVGIPL